MKQVVQNIRSGKLSVDEVPSAQFAGPGVIVATQASVISAGTEKMITEFAEKGLIGKARSKPQEVRKIIDKIKRDGLVETFRTVMTRLDQPMPLGYSAAGIVLAASPEVVSIKPGDRVACGGAGHAEVMFVPKNLVVPVPDNVDFDSASFATLGSIAMQGLRVAELVIGEKVAVIGLGLLGLITTQLVRAAGCRVIGADINPNRLELARKLGCDFVCPPNRLAAVVSEVTGNVGADAVIITAATASNEPVETAAEICRKKGRISVVGAVRMDIPRKPFYQKELQLRLSTSYGPGRYDSQYEDKGIDYPQAYVPWTEQRNMACVLDMVSQGKLDVKSLITHRFPIEEAETAYKLIKGEIQEPFLGIVLNYPKVEDRSPVPASQARKSPQRIEGGVGVGVIGAGNFANLMLIPALAKLPDARLVGLADVNGLAGNHTGRKFGFQRIVSDHRQLLEDPDIKVVFVTTRHNAHAPLVLEALKANKHVMVEKPLCITHDELLEIVKTADQKPDLSVMVGFNRRFAPMAVELKKYFKDAGPLGINYICNAGFTPKESWVQDPLVGGGRIIGEGCHFINWVIWLTNSAPVKVYAQSIGRETGKAFKDDNVMISLQLKDGSIATVSYLACGDKSHTKEHIEVFGGGCVGIIDDFRRGVFIRGGNTQKLKAATGKGHFEQWQAYIASLKEGRQAPVPFEEIITSTWATLKAIESLRTGQVMEI